MIISKNNRHIISVRLVFCLKIFWFDFIRVSRVSPLVFSGLLFSCSLILILSLHLAAIHFSFSLESTERSPFA